MGRANEIAVAIVNGAVGDYLARSGNGLATEMTFVRDGRPIRLADACAPNPRIVVLIHGLMAEESCWRDARGGDYGARLAADLGFHPLYLRYNSGLAIEENGAQFSALMERLVALWPVPIDEIVLIGHSMGGLVVRAACHVAAHEHHAWLGFVRRDFYLGTPHLGAPLERAGRVLNRVLHAVPDPVTRLVAVVADLRSGGLKDLGDAAIRPQDRGRGSWLRNPEHPVPLLPTIHHHLVAGTINKDPRIADLFGDLMVPVDSATGAPAKDTFIAHGVSHIGLARDDTVYTRLRAWLEEG